MALLQSDKYVDTNADAKIYREIIQNVTSTSTDKYLTIPDELPEYTQFFTIANCAGFVSIYNIIVTTLNHIVRTTIYEDANVRAPRLHGQSGDDHITVTLNTSTTPNPVYVTYIATGWV